MKTFNSVNYLGSLLKNQNSIQEEIKVDLKQEIHVIIQSKHTMNLKIKIYKTIILPVVLYGCQTWFQMPYGSMGITKNLLIIGS